MIPFEGSEVPPQARSDLSSDSSSSVRSSLRVVFSSSVWTLSANPASSVHIRTVGSSDWFMSSHTHSSSGRPHCWHISVDIYTSTLVLPPKIPLVFDWVV